MPKYNVTSSVAATFTEVVEAPNGAAAHSIVSSGDGADLPQLCSECSKHLKLDEFLEVLETELAEGEVELEEEEEEFDDEDDEDEDDYEDDEDE